MDVQRTLRLLACGLFVLTVICGFILPVGLLPSIVTVVLAAATAVVLLGSIVLTIKKNRSLRGFAQVLISGALLLCLVGSVGTHFCANQVLVELEQNETVVFDDDGYSVRLDGFKGKSLNDASFDVVLTRPDLVSYHETISQSEPLRIDGIEIHPMEYYPEYAIFLIQKNMFHPVTVVGGILFLIGIALLALPSVRKRGEQ